MKIIVCGEDVNKTSSITIWGKQALQYNEQCEENQLLKIKGFEAVTKTSYDHTSLPFTLKSSGMDSSIVLLDEKRVFSNLKYFIICLNK